MKRSDVRTILRAGARLVCAAVVATSASCHKENEATKAEGLRLDDPAKQELIVLEIEDERFTNADFLKYVRATVGEFWPNLTAEGASRLFDDFVDRKLIVRKAREQAVALTDEERTGYLAQLRNAMGDNGIRQAQTAPDPEALGEALLAKKYLALQIKNVEVTEGEVAEYYGRHKADYLQPERRQVSQILLPTEGKASEIRDRLKGSGEEEFRSIARSESVGPEAASGGAMGVFSPGQLPQELEKVIFALKEGEISPAVQSSYGYHIFRLDKLIDFRLLSAAEAAPLVRARLLEDRGKAAVDVHLTELKASLSWTPRPENLPFAYQRIES
jgi:hypothetical protein